MPSSPMPAYNRVDDAVPDCATVAIAASRTEPAYPYSIATPKMKKADEKAAKEAAAKKMVKPAAAGDGQAAGAKTNP